jgi:bifunctional UDP-N-acetylglucosamine pyrophosphorylase/glucosamine-1-phosphate N-acetyltransferase
MVIYAAKMSDATSSIAVILAAGLGTRMKSGTAKVLHRVAGRPLLFWPVELARASGCRRVVAVLGHQLETVRAALDARYGAGAIGVAEQKQQKGTGHAVQMAMPSLAGEPGDARVIVLSGDVPLLTRETIARLVDAARGPVAVVTMRPESPRGYGRMVRDAAGRLLRIVEDKDATPEQKAIREVNSGIYAFRLDFLRAHIGGLSSDNAQKELYLTDLVARAAAEGHDVPTIDAPPDEVAGVNDRVDLARLDAVARRQVNERWMREGVTMVAPETVCIDADVASIGKDTELRAGVQLRGATRVGAGVTIDVGCVLTDTDVGDGSNIKPYSVLTETRVGARAQIGPFSHCRPGSDLADDVHLGNFVETKKARLGAGAKANHLAYLGDADVGPKSNVGAGTITCNYDGKLKHKTVIGAGAFIGSDTQLVAPVTVGDGAYVGAGTTVVKDVPAGALAVSRAPQHNIEGWAERKARKQADKK